VGKRSFVAGKSFSATIHELPVHATRPVRVALVNDFELIVQGLSAMLRPFRDQITVVEQDVRERPHHRVDVALFDTYAQPDGGLALVRKLATNDRIGHVIVYTAHLDRAHIAAAQSAGADGVLDKALPGPELASAILAVASGETVVSRTPRDTRTLNWPGHEYGLTLRESEVAALLLQGMSNREIAEALYISEHTVKTHMKGILNKTSSRSRGQATARIADNADFRRITGNE
jgi:DNA-binding NarL/FixJ family response regulator